jgi:hypothetical protein
VTPAGQLVYALTGPTQRIAREAVTLAENVSCSWEPNVVRRALMGHGGRRILRFPEHVVTPGALRLRVLCYGVKHVPPRVVRLSREEKRAWVSVCECGSPVLLGRLLPAEDSPVCPRCLETMPW